MDIVIGVATVKRAQMLSEVCSTDFTTYAAFNVDDFVRYS